MIWTIKSWTEIDELHQYEMAVGDKPTNIHFTLKKRYAAVQDKSI